MTLEEYVEVSHKYGGPYGKPAGIPNLFSKYIEPCFERDPDAKYDKKAYSLWKNADFAACYHILPRDVDILIYYWHDSCHMFGYCPGVIITENYMCKFYIYPKYSSKFEDEYLLKYEHKNGDTINRSYPNITQLANAINDLVKNDTDLFGHISAESIPLQHDIDWLNEHIKYIPDEYGFTSTVTFDDKPIYIDKSGKFWLV